MRGNLTGVIVAIAVTEDVTAYIKNFNSDSFSCWFFSHLLPTVPVHLSMAFFVLTYTRSAVTSALGYLLCRLIFEEFLRYSEHLQINLLFTL